MNYLQTKRFFSLLAGMLLMSSFAAAAKAQDINTTLECSSNTPTKQCISYTRGYIDALLLLEQEPNSDFSPFEQRAFKTRVGNNKKSHPLKDKLGICLPEKVDAAEVLASISNKRPLNMALLEVLQMKYPC